MRRMNAGVKPESNLSTLDCSAKVVELPKADVAGR